MKNLKEQKPDAEIVQAVDVELNEAQLDVVSGGVWDGIDGGGCTGPIFQGGPKDFPDQYLPKSPDVIESIG